jgi:hypothetical protein
MTVPLTRSTLLALAVLTAGCTSDDPGAAEKPATTTAPMTLDARARQMAGELGCEDPGRAWQLHGDTRTLDCTADGRRTTRIITFGPGQRGRIERTFSKEELRVDPEGCGDGTQLARTWYVIGEDWMVITADERISGEVLARPDAELLNEGSLAPPVSYQLFPLCS